MTHLFKFKVCIIGVILLSFSVMTGCGSIIHGRLQEVPITTDPAGIQAAIRDRTCTTPCSMRVERAADYVEFERGPKRHVVRLEKRFNSGATVLGNLLWLPIGVPVDISTGAAYEILPINVKLSGFAVAPEAMSPVGSATGPEETSASTPPAALQREPASSAEAQLPPGTAADTMAVSVGVSNGLFTYDSLLLTGSLRLEKELIFTRAWLANLSAYLNVGYIDYRSTQGHFRDAARGGGAELGIRRYLSGRVLEGLYLGAGFGYWSLKGAWKDDVGTPFVTAGNGNAGTADGNVHIGYKWYPARFRNFFIDPSVMFGFMSSVSVPEPFGPSGYYLNTGVAVGRRW